MELHFGLGSWKNGHFDHGLYALRTPHDERLPRYAARFPVVEADLMHHQVMADDEIDRWIEQTPEGFLFLPKMHKSVTHGGFDEMALANVDEVMGPIQRLHAARRCGTVLYQFPGSFRRNDENERWLDELFMSGWTGPKAVEFRDASWFHPCTEALLKRHAAALVWSTYDKAIAPHWETTNPGYVRFVGTVNKKRGRWVTQRERVEDLLDMRAAVVASSLDSAYVIVTNRFEGNAIDSLPKVAAALGDQAFAKRCQRRPTEPLLA